MILSPCNKKVTHFLRVFFACSALIDIMGLCNVDVKNSKLYDVTHHVLAQPAPPPEASEPPGGDHNDQGGLAIMIMTIMIMTTMMKTLIVTVTMMIKIITSRVIGALGPRPRGGAPGAPGAPPPPAMVNIFIHLLFAFLSLQIFSCQPVASVSSVFVCVGH